MVPLTITVKNKPIWAGKDTSISRHLWSSNEGWGSAGAHLSLLHKTSGKQSGTAGTNTADIAELLPAALTAGSTEMEGVRGAEEEEEEENHDWMIRPLKSCFRGIALVTLTKYWQNYIQTGLEWMKTWEKNEDGKIAACRLKEYVRAAA